MSIKIMIDGKEINFDDVFIKDKIENIEPTFCKEIQIPPSYTIEQLIDKLEEERLEEIRIQRDEKINRLINKNNNM